jgi:hypothetical protein
MGQRLLSGFALDILFNLDLTMSCEWRAKKSWSWWTSQNVVIDNITKGGHRERG